MYIHLFSFHIQASNESIKYIIRTIATIGEENYRNILLGTCLQNMGIQYRAADFENFRRIREDMYNPMLKVGRIATRCEEITPDEIKNVLSYLGCNISSIYLKENEVEFLNELTNSPS